MNVTINASDGTQAAEAFLTMLKTVLEKKDIATVTVPGGSSIQPMFKAISSVTQDIDWRRVHFFMTDERYVPLDDERSNFKQANKLLFSTLPIPDENLHPYRVGTDVSTYQNELETVGANHIDICVLGVGEDGHVASLFPNHKALQYKTKEYISITDSPKPPKKRVSISPKHIRDSSYAMLFFLGERKREAYNMFNDEDVPFTQCPAKLALQAQTVVVTDLKDEQV